jgi:glycerate-2-kinase
MKKINIRMDYDIPMTEQDVIDLLEEYGIKTEFELEHFFKSELIETLKEQDCVVNKVFIKVIEE